MKDVFIKTDETIKQALKKLDQSTEKVLLVVDRDQTLLGALSDGDIRRALLKGNDIQSGIQDVYNADPVFILQSEYDRDKAAEIFLSKRIELLPIVNESGQVVDTINWSEALDTEKKKVIDPQNAIDIPVVIMAGGKGTRMAPFTHILPKPLIPIGEQTILELIMDEFKNFGLKHFYLTLNYKGEMIEAYFKSIDKDYLLHYCWEKEFLGTAGSLKLAEESIKDDFIVSNCDVIVKADYSKVLKFHQENNAAMTIVSSMQHYTIPYGVVKFGERGEVTEITEKPEYTFPINTGVYILSKKCFDLIPENEFYNMTDLIADLLGQGDKVLTYPVNEGDYIDIGQWEEYRNAIQKLGIMSNS